MGNAPELAIPSMVNSLPHTFSHPNKENPTLTCIRSRYQAEQAQRQVEQAAKVARELAEEAWWQADKKRKQACVCKIEADRAVARATEDANRMKGAAKVEQRAQELSKEARKAGRKERAKLGRKARKERKRSRKIREDVERVIAATRKDKERTLRAAEEKRRDAEAAMALAEAMSHAAAERAKKATEGNGEAARQLKESIQPVITPSPEEVVAAKWRIQYNEHCFHFAVVGVCGKRKSSLINAFRGFRWQVAGPATVGVRKATLQMTGYPDTNPKKPFIWYDIPGASTLKGRDWQYFNDRGLYVFDCIIVLFDGSQFSAADIATLLNARRFNIPTYIVRMNAYQHIRRTMIRKRRSEKGGDGENIEFRDKMYESARQEFIERTRKSVQANLEGANLPDQRVYIVSHTTLLSVVLNKTPKKVIDEVDLLNDLLSRAYSRRFIT